MISLLWLGTAPAQTVIRSQTVCVSYDTEYEDTASEDFWADNNVDRWARGVQIDVEDASGTSTMFVADTAGCATFSVKVIQPAEKYTVFVRSKARVKGVNYEVHRHVGPANFSNHVGLFGEEGFGLLATQATHEIVTSDEPGWQVMAAVSWMFHRSRFKISTGVSRSCCYDSEHANGTCSNSAFFYGTPSGETLHYFVSTDQGGCGGGNATPNVDDRLNAIELVGNCSSKNLFAHETGHLVVGMRMNGREGEGPLPPNTVSGWAQDAPVGGCSGDYWGWSGSPPAGVDPIDVGGDPSAKGLLTKEYGSNAIREGWGEFYAMWAWNSNNHSDCSFFPRRSFQDLDLDGFVDNSSPNRDLDCSLSNGWLGDMISAGGNGCVDATPIGGVEVEVNRSTTWDVGRMFWHHTVPLSPILSVVRSLWPGEGIGPLRQG